MKIHVISSIGMSKKAKAILDTIDKHIKYFTTSSGEKPKNITVKRDGYELITQGMKGKDTKPMYDGVMIKRGF